MENKNLEDQKNPVNTLKEMKASQRRKVFFYFFLLLLVVALPTSLLLSRKGKIPTIFQTSPPQNSISNPSFEEPASLPHDDSNRYNIWQTIIRNNSGGNISIANNISHSGQKSLQMYTGSGSIEAYLNFRLEIKQNIRSDDYNLRGKTVKLLSWLTTSVTL